MPTYSAAACTVCKRARRSEDWCDECEAPAVWPENAPVIALFLGLMPAWQAAGGMNAVISEGFDRTQIQALMDLQGIPATERPALTEQLLSLESEFADIRAQQRARDEAKKDAASAAKGAQSNRSTR